MQADEVVSAVASAAVTLRTRLEAWPDTMAAVLGGNLLAFGHLAGILFRYVRFTRRKAPFDALETWIVAYIPAYTAWSLIVSFAFPLALRFK